MGQHLLHGQPTGGIDNNHAGDQVLRGRRRNDRNLVRGRLGRHFGIAQTATTAAKRWDARQERVQAHAHAPHVRGGAMTGTDLVRVEFR
jgi:hypothetical protein